MTPGHGTILKSNTCVRAPETSCPKAPRLEPRNPLSARFRRNSNARPPGIVIASGRCYDPPPAQTNDPGFTQTAHRSTGRDKSGSAPVRHEGGSPPVRDEAGSVPIRDEAGSAPIRDEGG